MPRCRTESFVEDRMLFSDRVIRIEKANGPSVSGEFATLSSDQDFEAVR